MMWAFGRKVISKFKVKLDYVIINNYLAAECAKNVKKCYYFQVVILILFSREKYSQCEHYNSEISSTMKG